MNEVNNSVVKALKILELFRENEELTISQIHKITGYSKSAINRIVSSYEQEGYMRKNPENVTYRLSNKLYQIGINTNVNYNIIKIARPYIEKLIRELKVTVSLSVIENYRSCIIYQRKSSNLMHITPPLGYKGTLNCASGKVLVAFSDRVDEIIDVMDLEKRTPNSIIDKQKYYGVVKETKINGYAYEDEEIELGLYCMAVPILDKRGYCICSISISGYRNIMLQDIERKKEALMSCANMISKEFE